MPRKSRLKSPSGVYHWINRGITKKAIFHKADDHDFFKALLSEYGTQYSLSIYHYCFMSNHIHLLIKCEEVRDLSLFSQMVQRRYAYYYSKTYHWAGGIFQGRYRSFAVENDSYLLECGRYIERNPIKAGLVDRPEDYRHSSYHYYAYGAVDPLIHPSPAYLGLADQASMRQEYYRDYVTQLRPQELVVEQKAPF